MLAEIERGADAVGGIPSTALKGAGLLPHIRATVKLPMIVMKRTLQQLWAAHRLLSAVPAGCSVLMYCVSSVSLIVLKSKTLISPGHWWQTAIVFGRRIAASYTHRNATARVRNGVAGGVGLWATRSVCACIKGFYLAASVSSVYFLCCWLCFMALGFISLPGLMNSSPPGRMVWCWQCFRLSGSA